MLLIIQMMNLALNIHSSLELRDPNKSENGLPDLVRPSPKECRICLSGGE
jgi:hypothetical protein